MTDRIATRRTRCGLETTDGCVVSLYVDEDAGRGSLMIEERSGRVRSRSLRGLDLLVVIEVLDAAGARAGRGRPLAIDLSVLRARTDHPALPVNRSAPIGNS